MTARTLLLQGGAGDGTRHRHNPHVPHSEDMTRRAGSFGSVAESYERYRPTYPDTLIDDVLAHAGERARQGVLDIGAGTGKATLLVARAGFPVTALEPASEMAEVLRRRVDDAGLSGRVTVRVGAFESLTADDGPFGLVVAAQSFHWTDPETRWQRLVEVLAPGGTAALFWNRWRLDGAVHDHDALRRAYAEHGPDLAPDLDEIDQVADWPRREILQAPDLVGLVESVYAWTWHLSTEDYLALLATTSQYSVLPADARGRLFDSLVVVLGDDVALQGSTLLSRMRRSAGG
jgi:SAM-dependent methyltransferase